MKSNNANRDIESRKPKVCVISFSMPSEIVTNVLLYTLIDIIIIICDTLYVITSNVPENMQFGEDVEMLDIKTALYIKHKTNFGILFPMCQIFKILFIQMKMSWTLIKVSRKIDIVLFYVGGANLFLPTLVAKILRKKVAASAIGLGSRSYKSAQKQTFVNGIIFYIFYILEKATFSLSDAIIVESKSVIKFLNLEKYEQKIESQGARYIDPSFKVEKPLKERGNLIGYIGRLDGGKGVMNFVKAISLIEQAQGGIKFVIGGNGPLYDDINKLISFSNYCNVDLLGWVPHIEMTDYLNELKLYVLPSNSEGLPTVILEAMACGTPVLATPVGGIPDVIKDGETGFLMENNSPECIAANVIRALEHPDLEGVAVRARALVEREFTFEKAVERWREVLEDVCDDRR